MGWRLPHGAAVWPGPGRLCVVGSTNPAGPGSSGPLFHRVQDDCEVTQHTVCPWAVVKHQEAQEAKLAIVTSLEIPTRVR